MKSEYELWRDELAGKRGGGFGVWAVVAGVAIVVVGLIGLRYA